MQPSVLLIPGLISSCITLFLGIKVYREDPRKIQHRIFTLLMLSFFILSICSFFINLTKDDVFILFVGRIFYFAAILCPVFFLHFCYVFPKRFIDKGQKNIFIVPYIISLFLYLYFHIHSSVDNIHKTPYGNYFYFNEETFFIGFYLCLILIIATCLICFKYLKTDSYLEKQQIKNVLLGGFFSVVIVVMHIVLLFFKIQTYFIIPLAISIFSLFIAAAILKFNVFIYKPMEEMVLSHETVALLNRHQLEKEVEARSTALLSANETLKQEIEQRRKTEEELKESLNEKEILLKEIHHRVKNNLQIISSLIYLQTNKLKDKKIIETLQEVNSRIRSMSLIHENIYKSNGFDSINFKEYVQTIVHELVSIYSKDTKRINVKIMIKDAYLSIDTSILLGLILNELVTNALKHAFPDDQAGELFIEARSDERSFIMTVRDNGVGLKNKIDVKNTKTLGLQLVNNLVRQLNGSFDFVQNEWTEFTIRFPKK
ncbi:MAG: histidine kinase dimerization/phosphoacceptor domain -containing protein [Candidatus Thermoplasmatota archaeon]|nr:histidine kinase dimerization/phosphoacceptor domain -containing protein [Candidatus Thermoplasmatota archaeon]